LRLILKFSEKASTLSMRVDFPIEPSG
jgi:hypothetical protein